MKKNIISVLISIVLALTIIYLIICKVSSTDRPVKFHYNSKIIGVFEYEQD